MKMFNPPHPGNILRELYLEQLGISVTKTAQVLHVARKTFSSLLNGHSGISPEMAIRLSKAFDTTPEYWMNLQQQYDLWKARQNKDLSNIKPLTQTAA